MQLNSYDRGKADAVARLDGASLRRSSGEPPIATIPEGEAASAVL